jgi:hypothetical protein
MPTHSAGGPLRRCAVRALRSMLAADWLKRDRQV